MMGWLIGRNLGGDSYSLCWLGVGDRFYQAGVTSLDNQIRLLGRQLLRDSWLTPWVFFVLRKFFRSDVVCW